MPASTRISVVLPAPLWPTRPRRSPCFSVKLMPSSACTKRNAPSLLDTLPPTRAAALIARCRNERAFGGATGNSMPTLLASIRGMAGVGPIIFRSGPVDDTRAIASVDVGHHGGGQCDEQDRSDPALQVR